MEGDVANGDGSVKKSLSLDESKLTKGKPRTPKLGILPRFNRVVSSPSPETETLPPSIVVAEDHRWASSSPELAERGDGGSNDRRSSWSSEMDPPRSPYRRPARLLERRPTVETEHVVWEEKEDYTQLNQYQIRQEIGVGSYGVVCSATDERNKKYAVKMISKRKLKKATFGRRPMRGPAKANHQGPTQMLQREIAILKKLNHPNVVGLVEVLDDETHDELYLVFELVERGPVMEVPTKETFSEERARHYVIDTLLGMEYLHFQKVIHRDIKPDNLLLTNDDHIKIADFGVSELFEASDANLTKTAGSPSFMAPESLLQSGPTFRGKATDVWAMGVTLYCFIFGNCPFRSFNILELYEMIKSQAVDYPDDTHISLDLRDLFDQIFEKNPSKRITVPAMKMHPWVTLQGQDTLPTTEENCKPVEVTDEEIANATKDFASFPVLVLLKAMARRKSFRNPFLASKSKSTSTESNIVEERGEANRN
eukprot:m.17543 g.17543  ORF g.17543 m.17543 type:complete len:482 (+) comp27514_c0_seq3:132-1577(+)